MHIWTPKSMSGQSIADFIARGGSSLRCVFQHGLNVWLPVCAAAFLFAGGAAAKAEHVNIVAIGESNTEGYGLKSSYAYPAILERLLRARGYDVSVTNEGVSGITTASILNRLSSAIPNGTKIVILQMGNYNDGVMGVSLAQSEANIKEAIARVRSRVSKLIFIGTPMFLTIPRSLYQGDGLHLTEQGQAVMAQKILPQVEKAIASR
jgi:acyl-CoA thioesterase I